MSLVINADSEYLQGTVAVGSGETEMCLFGWVKRDDGSRSAESFMGFSTGNLDEGANNYIDIGRVQDGANSTLDGYVSGADTYRANSLGTMNSSSTAWCFYLFKYKAGEVPKVYFGVQGGSLVSSNVTGSAASATAFYVTNYGWRLGKGGYQTTSWQMRGKEAYCGVARKAPSDADVAELFNGGTSSAGKHCTLVFTDSELLGWRDLVSDSSGGKGGTLTATGTITYDGADNPNIDMGGGGGSATGAAANYYAQL